MGPTETQNLTVVLRVRPPTERHVGKDRIVHVLDGQMVILTDPRDEDDILRAKRSREKRYMFDIAFDSYNTQLDVYLATTKPLISSVLDGFNATVFAYGPTGTGKTYTMLGTGDNPGIMALALNEIFALVRKGSENSTYTVYMSYLEVYNELIRDLLCPESGDLELREDSTGVTVAGLEEVEAQSTREVMDMLRDGNKRRTTEPTSVNKTSSRSHAVLQVTVKKLGRARSLTETVSTGKLYMIDLAGSERATHTKNRGTRLVEGAHINRSLLALGNCIKALSNNTSSYVNYRDSKLTRLLKDSLGGNCRTVMIAHVSPDCHVFDESRNTLQYADRAKRIKTKIRPNLQTVSHHIAKYPIIVEELHKEIARLKKINSKGSDTQSLESESGILPVKDRELLETKRAQLDRAFNKQLKNKERLSRLEGQQKLGGHKTGHLQSLLHQHIESRPLYNILPPIHGALPPLTPTSTSQPELLPSSSQPDLSSSPQPLTPASQLDIESKEIEIRSALRRQSARKRREENSKDKLLRVSSNLAEKYRAVEEDIEDKILDTDHKELLGLVSNVHVLELQLAGSREQVHSLGAVVEEQGHWLNSHYQYNIQLLEVVRTQHQLLTNNNVHNTPQLDKLYEKLQERSLTQYNVLPRIRSAVSSITAESEEDSPPSTPPLSDHTPVFTKTYNVVDKDGEGGDMISKLEERDVSQTTMHVLSTPSLTERDPTVTLVTRDSTTLIERNRTVTLPNKSDLEIQEGEADVGSPEEEAEEITRPPIQSKVVTSPNEPGTTPNVVETSSVVRSNSSANSLVKKVHFPEKEIAEKEKPPKQKTKKERAGEDVVEETSGTENQAKKIVKSPSLTGTWKALKKLVRSKGSAGGRESPAGATPQRNGITPRGGGVTPRRSGVSLRNEENGVSLVKSTNELLPSLPPTGSSPAPGKQAKKAIQLQRLRTLKTEPVLSTPPKQKPRGKKTKNLNKAHVKSDTHIKIAEKARIYGGPGNARTPQTRGRKQGGPQRKTNNPNISINGTNKNFPLKVFR
ncbi:kinesin-like protein KIF19 isoform X2 [Bolinopsis microptera]|uniref:kinesin-like protein KIF19 isoform X2 n=1 Tax=Bolinopsis microptera TaxID=2820187 RepID=UPI003079238A